METSGVPLDARVLRDVGGEFNAAVMA